MAKKVQKKPGIVPDNAPAGLFINAQYLKDLSFENPNPLDAYKKDAEKPNIQVNVNTTVKKLHNKFHYLEKIFSKNELLVMIIFRFVGLVPFFIANLLPVIFNISIKNYYLGTLIGIFPAIFIMI